MAEKLTGSAIQTGTITTTQLSTAVADSISAGGGPKISSLIYPGDDTAANTAGGQTVYINGSGFAANSNVYINGNAAPSVSFISSSNLEITTPALSAATYPVYVINPENGATAIFIPGLEISGEPTWSTSATLPEQDVDTPWNITLSATSDSNVSYALAGGSSLPSGISLAANGLISGTLSSPPASETTYNFTVVATDAENQDASRAFSVSVTLGDEYFKDTVLLLHADGTNNQNNHTFLDSSNNNFTITRNGNATQGSFSPFSQTGWSGYFDGTGDHLSIAANTALALDSSNFTIEAWVYADSAFATDPILESRSSSSSSAGYAFLVTSDGKLNVYNSGGFLGASTTALQRNIWYHVALVRSGTGTNETTFYINGTSSGTITLSANLTDGSTQVTRIGGSTSAGENWNGYISNLRVLKGTALYTSNFTPPTAPLTNIANTSLLTLQSNRFVDNSNNNFTITRNGDVRIVPYSPFAPTSAYTTAAVGGSAYFDGTGDYLTTTMPALSTGSFTVEFWFHPTNPGLAYLILDKGFRDGNFSLQTDYLYSGVFYLNVGGTSYTISFTPPIVNQWNHIAICRDSSSLRFFLNGVQLGTTQTNSGDVTTGTLYIGAASTTGSGYSATQGYISNLRITTTAVYTSNFTPPTAPVTNIANTSLLCNFTNAGIYDQTAKHVIETIGDAKISTSVVKYGTGSIAFDGTGDYLEVKDKHLFNFGAGDFTIEMWFYANASGGALIGKGPSDSDDEMFFYLYGGVYYIDWGPTSGAYMQGGSYSLSQWNHLALVRNGTSLVLYHNGTSALSTTLTANYSFTGNHTLKIGAGRGGSFNYNGYIDDLRISRFARYTSNFTPPTAAFKDR